MNEKGKVPLSFSIWMVGIAAAGSMAWADLRHQVKDFSKDAVSENQVRHWIDNARDKNPQIAWPSLPEKNNPPDVSVGKMDAGSQLSKLDSIVTGLQIKSDRAPLSVRMELAPKISAALREYHECQARILDSAMLETDQKFQSVKSATSEDKNRL